MKDKSIIKWGALLSVMLLCAWIGIRTPLTGEAQLIGKTFLLLCMCYLIVQFLLGVFLVTSKKMGFLFFIRSLIVFIFCISLAIFLINIPFDYVMSLLENREIPNSGCSIIALTLLMVSILIKNRLHFIIENR